MPLAGIFAGVALAGSMMMIGFNQEGRDTSVLQWPIEGHASPARSIDQTRFQILGIGRATVLTF